MSKRTDAQPALIRAFQPLQHLYAEGTLDVLLARYSEAHRAYHNEVHIAHLLELLDQFQDKAIRPEILTSAILWHDAVYTTQNADGSARPDSMNVRESAELFKQHAIHMNEEDQNAVFDIIMATSGHNPPQQDAPHYKGFTQDAGLMLDFDLHSLAMAPKEFDANTKAIRREFSWVDDATFNKNVAAMLANFSERTTLYHAVPKNVQKEWNENAQMNFSRSLAALRAPAA